MSFPTAAALAAGHRPARPDRLWAGDHGISIPRQRCAPCRAGQVGTGRESRRRRGRPGHRRRADRRAHEARRLLQPGHRERDPPLGGQKRASSSKNRLAPELRLIEGNKGIAALLAGETQFADIGGSQTLAAAANGADLTILGIIGPKFPFLFMVPATIQGADDLRGKNVGVSTIGDSSDIATRLALPRLGLDPNADVTIVATGSSQNRRTALLNGALQAGMSTMPEEPQPGAQGFHTLVDLTALDLPTATQGEVGPAVVRRRPPRRGPAVH